MRLDTPTVAEADVLADLWVRLAEGQKRHGSHLRSDANRTTAENTLARYAVTDGLRVARADGDIVGFVMFERETGGFEQDVTRGIVRNLFVRPDWRNCGVGSDLLAAAESALAASGADTVALEAMADNDAARRFYRRHGYREHRIEFEKSLESDRHSKEGT